MNEEEKYECSICLDVLDNNDIICLGECKHKFHRYCINEWYKKSNTCPICRKPIKDIFRVTHTQKFTLNKNKYFIDLQENKVVLYNLIKLKKNSNYLELGQILNVNNVLCDIKKNERIGDIHFIILYQDFSRIRYNKNCVIFENLTYCDKIDKQKAITKQNKTLKFYFKNGIESSRFFEILRKRHQYFVQFNN